MQVPRVVHVTLDEEVGGDDHPCRRGDGESREVAALLRGHLRVEPRQADRAAHDEQGARPEGEVRRPGVQLDPSALDLGEALLHQERRGDAEGHHVRQRVILQAEAARRARQARHRPVQGVEHRRHQDQVARLVELGLGRCDDREHRAEQAGAGEQVRQEVDGLPPPAQLAQGRGFLAGAGIRHERDPAARRGGSAVAGSSPTGAGITASSVVPPLTPCPTRTRTFASRGRNTSTREPNWIRP